MDSGVTYLKALDKFATQPGHQRILALLDALGNPQDSFRSIHVAGTNGKGSTCAIIYSILLASGHRAGLFSKPHLQDYRERMRAMGSLIPQDDLESLIRTIKGFSEAIEARGLGYPTEFETGFAIALEWFRRVGIDIAVIETGMGGRLDSTNIIRPMVSVITPIAIDHTERLGSSLKDIAFEKAGIMKPGVPVVAASGSYQDATALAILRETASTLGCWVSEVGPSGETPRGWEFAMKSKDWYGSVMDLVSPEGYEYEDIRVNLLGDHQMLNASVAWAACSALESSGIHMVEERLREGIGAAVWPGRMELIGSSPRVMLDGTTNPHGSKALAKGLSGLLCCERGMDLHLVMGISIDKDPKEMMADLLPQAASITLTKARSSRLGTHEPEDLAALVAEMMPGLPTRVHNDAHGAVGMALSSSKPGDLVCICGSLYLVGEVRGIWRQAE